MKPSSRQARQGRQVSFSDRIAGLQDSILQGNLVILSKSRELFVAFGVFRGHSHSAKPPRPLRTSRTSRETLSHAKLAKDAKFLFQTGLQDLQDSILQGNLVNLVILSKSRELFVAFGVFR
ncbi:MAG: hypothetical protein ACOX9C_11935, partial [Kiritimatiellia bacterium]